MTWREFNYKSGNDARCNAAGSTTLNGNAVADWDSTANWDRHQSTLNRMANPDPSQSIAKLKSVGMQTL